jgi:hypothetical protein
MAVHFRGFHLAVGALGALLAVPAVYVALADEIDQSRQTCDNLKSDPDDRIPACTRLLDSGRKDFDVGTIYSTRANVWYLKGNFDNAVVDYQGQPEDPGHPNPAALAASGWCC